MADHEHWVVDSKLEQASKIVVWWYFGEKNIEQINKYTGERQLQNVNIFQV